MNLSPGTFLAVEGSIGAGKTSLARILAQELDAEMVLEEEITNPFLADFYRDPNRFALCTQLTFLLSRHQQQSKLRQLNLFNKIVISDYIFEKDRIFAHLNLEDRELEIYNRVETLLSGDIPTPDLVIYLQASPERLLTNIRVRDIDYERAVTLNYLEHINEAYRTFFFNWDKSPLLIVNASKIDLTNNERHCAMLLRIIKEIPSGTTYFNPEA